MKLLRLSVTVNGVVTDVSCMMDNLSRVDGTTDYPAIKGSQLQVSKCTGTTTATNAILQHPLGDQRLRPELLFMKDSVESYC